MYIYKLYIHTPHKQHLKGLTMLEGRKKKKHIYAYVYYCMQLASYMCLCVHTCMHTYIRMHTLHKQHIKGLTMVEGKGQEETYTNICVLLHVGFVYVSVCTCMHAYIHTYVYIHYINSISKA